MKEILTLSITRLTEKLFIALMIVVKDLVAMHDVLTQRVSFFVNKFNAAYDHLNEIYQKYDLKKYTDDVQKQDEKRVVAFRKMKDAIRYEFTYPSSDAKTAAAKTLLDIIDLYDLADISKLKMAEKTAALTNLIEDFEDKYQQEVETLEISALLTDLRQQQDEFMRLYLIRNDIDSEFGLRAMADARTRMTEAYRDLVAAVNLAAKDDPEGLLTQFINQMNVEIRKNFVYTGQHASADSGAGTGSDSEDVIRFKTATFDFANGDQIKRQVEVGTVLIAPDNTFGYIWNKEIPERMPNKNVTFKEIPITSKEAVAMFHFFDHREEEIRQLVGSVLNAPANSPGYVWDPAVPATMPDGDTSYYEMPVEGGNGSGSGSGEPRMVRADFFYLDGTEYNMTGEPGTRLIAPEPDSGNYWEPTPPMYFPDHDTEYHEVEGSDEGDGDDDAGFGR